MSPIKRFAVLLILATAVRAQESYLSVSDPGWKGIEIRFATRIEPGGAVLSGGVNIGSGQVHHVINDDSHKRSFGYDLGLDMTEDGKTAQLRIEPLRSSRFLNSGWTLLTLPKYPVIPNLHVGDTVALDLLVNQATGQKIVDYLTLRRHGEMDLQREPRDFTLADVELTLMEPQVWVSGKLEVTDRLGGTSGAVVWLNLAGHGRYVLSLVPNEKLGFKKSGVVSANGMRFHDGTTEIRVQCGSRIAPASGAYNLYILRETASSGNGLFGSADRAEWAVKKH
jgi:hypothetical protein